MLSKFHACCIAVLQVNEAAEIIYDLVDPDANLIFGAVIDPTMDQEVDITLIATGVGAGEPGNNRHNGASRHSNANDQAAGVAQAAAGALSSSIQYQQRTPAAAVAATAAAAQAVRPAVVVERPTPSNPRVRTDVPTGGVEIPAFLRRRGLKGK